MVTAFPCTGCGACCRRVGSILDGDREGLDAVTREAVDAFPYGVLPDGSCEQFDGLLCKVYADRPLLCRVDDMAKARGWPQADAWAVNAAVCNAMQEHDGIPRRYRVKLPVLP